jgi:3-oxoacyl-[acyl-carrier protein] reductase
VTRAAAGIGKAIAGAWRQPRPGWWSTTRTPELAAAAVADIQAAGGVALAVAAGISDRAQYQTMVERLLRECGRWDVPVNNAAVVPRFAA